MSAPFAARHITFWEWVENLQRGKRPTPFVAIWPRGGAKSTSVEMACVRVGALSSRQYIWYVCGTQDQADMHVETIGSMLESETVENYHRALAARKLGKYGHSRGWRRSRLRTASGLTIDALGLDTFMRGKKTEEQRPDFIVLDDVDDLTDTPAKTAKKIRNITKNILPAGDNSLAVLFVQNLIHPDSVASQLADGRADFLADRIVDGPHPAVEGLTYEQVEGRFRVTGGVATWEGQSLDIAQEQIDTWGLTSFLQEAQHEVEAPPGGIWDHIEFVHCDFSEVPELIRGGVWVDPAVTATDQSDSQGIQADGLGVDGKVYRFYSWEQVTSPEDVLRRAILKALDLNFEKVGVETDQGGDTWATAYEKVCRDLREDDDYPAITAETRLPYFDSAKAGAGYGSKVHRNQQMLADYERGQVVHVRGTHNSLERALKRFPLSKPLDLADAAFWGWNDLRNRGVVVTKNPFYS